MKTRVTSHNNRNTNPPIRKLKPKTKATARKKRSKTSLSTTRNIKCHTIDPEEKRALALFLEQEIRSANKAHHTRNEYSIIYRIMRALCDQLLSVYITLQLEDQDDSGEDEDIHIQHVWQTIVERDSNFTSLFASRDHFDRITCALKSLDRMIHYEFGDPDRRRHFFTYPKIMRSDESLRGWGENTIVSISAPELKQHVDKMHCLVSDSANIRNMNVLIEMLQFLSSCYFDNVLLHLPENDIHAHRLIF